MGLHTVWSSNVVPAEIVRRPSAGGLQIFWAKSLVITAIYTNLSLIFVYLARITSDLTHKIRRPPAEGLRGRISAGTTLLVHRVEVQY